MSQNKIIQVLIIEDDPAHAEMLRYNLDSVGGMNITLAENLEDGLEVVAASPPDIVLIDLHLPDGSALDFLSQTKGKFPVVTLTNKGSEEQAVEVLKTDALDYIIKSTETFASMPRLVERALGEWHLQQQNKLAVVKLRSSEQQMREQMSLVEALLQNTAIPIFVIDPEHQVFIWNKACETLTGVKAQEVVGTDRHWTGFYQEQRPCLADLILAGSPPDQLLELYPKFSRSELLEEGLQAESWLTGSDGVPVYLTFNAALVRDVNGNVIAAIETLQDITARKKTEDELYKSRENLRIQHDRLEQANRELKEAHLQQLQSEKMASIGQLAAGVAHEINNPIGFVSSNLRSLKKYIDKLHDFIAFQDQELTKHKDAQLRDNIAAKRKQLKVDIILEDLVDLLAESRDGVDRVGKIVSDLKGFSRIDEAEYILADIAECLESSINIVWNEIKYKASLTRDFADLPQIPCYPGQLIQVFVNLLVNAVQSITTQGTIDLKTWRSENTVHVRISDSGCGISEDHCKRIFDPFFTTKEVGKGTGLGLSISYDIIKKHQGEISVDSRLNKGTSFTITLPIAPDESVRQEIFGTPTS